MKLSVLALDYDGTIARDDALDPGAREAIAAARAAGITVLLVTGRRLEDLRHVAGDLHFVDGVIAEDGAVLHFPASGHTSVLAPPVPPVFLEDLRRRGIPHVEGHCLVDAAADEAERLIESIRALELPLVLIFNRSRVEVLAQGISKATGARAALATLRLSPRNMVAIGDAENDHELLRLAEVGAAVGWGSTALQQAADVVIDGTGPEAVAAFVRGLAEAGRLPPSRLGRRRLQLGHTADGRAFSLGVRGRNVLVAGDTKSGKSWVAGLLCEQMILHGYSLCVIDPEGDYRSLEALPGVLALGGEDPPPTPRELLRALRYPDRSVVIDLSRIRHDEKIEYIRATLPALNEVRRRIGFPHRIVVDEAHYFLQDAGAHHLLDLEANGYTVVSYWASHLPAELLAATEVIVLTRESNPAEIRMLQQRCAAVGADSAVEWADIGRLPTGQAVALPMAEEAAGRPVRFTLGPRLTPHVRHREKYVDVPIMESRAFVFVADERGRPLRARTLRQFVAGLERPSPALDGHARRGDFSRWIADVFGDHALAGEIRALEDRHRQSPAPERIVEMSAAVRARYDLDAVPGR